MSEYNFDASGADAARQADTVNGRITETGKYIGQFTKAKRMISEKGTIGIEFAFKADSGHTADYLSVWTTNAKGEQIYGYKQLMALMACLKVRGIDAVVGEVEEYDSASGQMVTNKVPLYQGLMNKPIGVLLQMEEYAKKDQSIGTRPVFAGFFDAATEQVATEILDKKNPEILARQVAALQPVRKLKGSRAAGHPATGGNNGLPDNFGDDIPF